MSKTNEGVEDYIPHQYRPAPTQLSSANAIILHSRFLPSCHDLCSHFTFLSSYNSCFFFTCNISLRLLFKSYLPFTMSVFFFLVSVLSSDSSLHTFFFHYPSLLIALLCPSYVSTSSLPLVLEVCLLPFNASFPSPSAFQTFFPTLFSDLWSPSLCSVIYHCSFLPCPLTLMRIFFSF